MTRSEFFEKVKDAVLVKIKDEDNSLDAAISEVMKSNGVVYHGLTFRGNDSVQPVIYLDDFFAKYSDGIDFDEIVDTVANMYFLSRKNKDFDISVLASFEAAKEHITVAVMNTELNERLLEEIPHRNFEDLSLYYRVEFEFSDSTGIGSVKISNSLMNTWKVSEEEIHGAAIANTLDKYGAVCRDMFDVIHDIMSDENCIDEEMQNTGMFVLSNDKTTNGAVLIYPEFKQLEKVADALADDLIILPSSKNEVIVLKAEMADGNDIDFFKNMVREVNETSVSVEDFLSNNVYYFNRSKNELKIA